MSVLFALAATTAAHRVDDAANAGTNRTNQDDRTSPNPEAGKDELKNFEHYRTAR